MFLLFVLHFDFTIFLAPLCKIFLSIHYLILDIIWWVDFSLVLTFYHVSHSVRFVFTLYSIFYFSNNFDLKFNGYNLCCDLDNHRQNFTIRRPTSTVTFFLFLLVFFFDSAVAPQMGTAYIITEFTTSTSIVLFESKSPFTFGISLPRIDILFFLLIFYVWGKNLLLVL